MAPGPLKVLDKFGPVFNIFKVNLFDWCAGDDEAIIIAVLDVIPFKIDLV